MRILFAGAGALGSRFGYMLFENGEDVSYLSFPDNRCPHRL